MQNLLFASLDFQYYWATHTDLLSFVYNFLPPNANLTVFGIWRIFFYIFAFEFSQQKAKNTFVF